MATAGARPGDGREKGEKMSSARWLAGAVAVGVTLLTGIVPGISAQEAPTGTLTAAPVAGAATPASPGSPPLSYDGLRVERDGVPVPYGVWSQWAPLLVATPDGGAWAFFTAETGDVAGPGRLRLHAARYDPGRAGWLPARAMPGGEVQFGPAAAVDRAGAVHLVYADRGRDAADAFATLVYSRSDGAGGWTPPVPVSPDPNAGHQMMPSLAVDGDDRLHLLWRDQRTLPADRRAASAANADVLASDLVDGTWSAPVPVNDRPEPDLNAAWPHLVVDGDRLVAAWSIYKGVTPAELEKPAVRVEWSSRPVGGGSWATPTPVVQREDGEIGGLLLDLAADPRGGTVLVYGRSFRTGDEPTVDLFLRRLPAGAGRWEADTPLLSGDLGYFPTLAVGRDGTLFVAFNHGRNRAVEVGAIALGPDAARPGPLQIPTTGEEGEHGRASLALGADGRPWVVYMHGAADSRTIELRSSRSLELPR